jgi:hypothetical protein
MQRFQNLGNKIFNIAEYLLFKFNEVVVCKVCALYCILSISFLPYEKNRFSWIKQSFYKSMVLPRDIVEVIHWLEFSRFSNGLFYF